jgi:hypothetical protein
MQKRVSVAGLCFLRGWSMWPWQSPSGLWVKRYSGSPSANQEGRAWFNTLVIVGLPAG